MISLFSFSPINFKMYLKWHVNIFNIIFKLNFIVNLQYKKLLKQIYKNFALSIDIICHLDLVFFKVSYFHYSL